MSRKSSGKIVEQGRRRLAGRPAREVARVVLDPVAVADLAQHLEVETGALLEPLALEQLAARPRARRSRSLSSSPMADGRAQHSLRGVT